MKVLVTGAKGQLGSELCHFLKCKGISYVAFDSLSLDIRDQERVFAMVSKEQPTHIINAAAYTQVDQCEQESDLAYAVNALGPQNLAKASKEIGATLIHISSDFVFDGSLNRPYQESDITNPINVYGKSKLEGEKGILSVYDKVFIIRTSWLYGRYGHNFVKTMIRLGQSHSALRVVDDQIGTPTYVTDLIEFIDKVLETEHYGIYHYANRSQCTWYDFAKAIFDRMNMPVNLIAISSDAYGAPAPRPAYSVLDTHKARETFGISIRDWDHALNDMIKEA